jgi:amino acid transporter
VGSGDPGHLRPGILGLIHGLGQSVAVLNLAAAGTIVAAAAAHAGDRVPWAFVVAGIGCLSLASIFVRFSSRMASAGGLYTYIARGLGPKSGFVGGWLYAGAFAVAVSVVLTIGAASLSALLAAHTGWQPGWLSCFLILIVALSIFAFLDVRLSTGTQVAVGAGCLFAILLLAIVVLAKGGAGVSAGPVGQAGGSSHGLFLGVAFAFAAFLGFEAAAALGEESSRPRTTIPRAILISAVLVVTWYVFIAWTVVIGFGRGRSADWADDIAPFDTLAARYAGSWLVVLVDLAVVASSFIAALACTNLTARTCFAMGREGGLPRVFAWVHPRFRTPWAGVAATLGLSVLLAAALGPRWTAPAPAPFPFVQALALGLTIAVLVAYVLVAMSALVFFWRAGRSAGRPSVALDVGVPLVAIAVCGFTIYQSLRPLPARPVAYGPLIVLAWLVLGLAVLAWLNMRRPDRVQAFGSILGEGASEPER